MLFSEGWHDIGSCYKTINLAHSTTDAILLIAWLCKFVVKITLIYVMETEVCGQDVSVVNSKW